VAEPSQPPGELLSLDLERALRWAAVWHRDQERRGSGVPYVQHAMAVAMILDRLGFAEEVVIAGLLHDVVEDTEATLDQVRSLFGAAVAEIVRYCSEVKFDAEGRKRPWIDRKRDHLNALAHAPTPARAVVLADKLHNLRSIQLDLREGRPVWSHFHADRDQVLWYYRCAIERLGRDDPRLEILARRCRQVLAEVEAHGGKPSP
jgi:(p)ppGpp synthase/HD superfamily hydrolase